jgi:hypothetical protein
MSKKEEAVDSTLRKQGLLAEIRVARHLIAELESEMK